MRRFLSDDELAHTTGAETHLLRSPVPTAIVSNGEFDPTPQSTQQRQVEVAITAAVERCGKRLGVDRRRFLARAAGLAIAFLAMIQVYGAVFGVTEADAREPEAADARAAALPGQLVFDVQLHFIRDDFNWQPPAQIMSFAGEHWYPQWTKQGLDLKRFGYAPLGPADSSAKNEIFGLNAAKLYGLDPAALLKSVQADQLEQMRARYHAQGHLRSNLA